MIDGLVSTIIPVYNRPTQLREAVASVLAQDWRTLEVIVVDDGSSDGTFRLAQALARQNPGIVHAVTQSNTGPGAARERGRLMAQGEFIQYLDSDDILLPGKFSAQVRALRAQPECDVAYGMTRFRHANGTLADGPWKDSRHSKGDDVSPSFLADRWWDTPTPLYRRAICDRAGPWSDLRLEEDWEYDCRVASLGARLAWCDQYVCEVRDHTGDRLCRGPALDPERMRQRARSHALIFSHAQRAGISGDTPQMQHFARALFLLARQCGAAGLATESRELFELSRTACGTPRARGLDYLAYRAVAHTIGWQGAGKASQWLDEMRGSR